MIGKYTIVIFGKPYRVYSMIFKDFSYIEKLDVFFGYENKENIFIPKIDIINCFSINDLNRE